MTKFEYMTTEVLLDDVENTLNAHGEDGWELVNVGMSQRPAKPTLSYNPAIPQYETKLVLIFKRTK
jgi:hypothetical protein